MKTSSSTSVLATTQRQAIRKAVRPKNMKQLYGRHKVYLCQQGEVWHLLHAVRDWAAIGDRFGRQVAYFDPHASVGAGGWFLETVFNSDQRITVKSLLSKIGGGEVCMLGKNCPKHSS